jgi:hypothetical protein
MYEAFALTCNQVVRSKDFWEVDVMLWKERFGKEGKICAYNREALRYVESAFEAPYVRRKKCLYVIVWIGESKIFVKADLHEQ